MERSIQQFLERLRVERGAAKNTLLAYRTDLDQFQRVLAARGVAAPEELDAAVLESYVGWLQMQGYRPATISRKLAVARSYLEFVGHAIGVREEPLRRVLRAPSNPRSEPRTLSPEELDRLLEAPMRRKNAGSIRDSAILSVLYETAFRAAEIVNLQLRDLNIEAALLLKPPARIKVYSIPRSVEPLRRYLRESRPQLSKQPGEQTLFLNQRGNGLSRQGLWLVVKRWASAADLGDDLSPQTLRHTRARDLLRAGHSRREVQAFLGLSSPNAIRIHRTTRQAEAE